MKSAKKQKCHFLTSFVLLLTVLILSVSCVGCSQISFLPKNDEELPTTDTEAPGDVPAISNPEPPPAIFYNRYTGLACDEAISSCRPISVCMSNFDENRQEGLSFADILTEAPIDGDKTRLWALTTNPAIAGTLSSVATVRDYMMPICNAFGSIGAYAGTTDKVGMGATVYPGDNLDYLYHNLSATFIKDESGTLSTTGQALQSAAAGRGYSLKDTESPLPYRFTSPDTTHTPNSNHIRSISFRFSMANTVAFHYDQTTGKYLREQAGAAHIDTANGEQLSFSNVLLLFHNVNYYHSATETTFSLDTESGGDGYCYTGGGVTPIHWSYNADGTLSITDDNGDSILLNRGKTYIGMLRITDSASLIAK